MGELIQLPLPHGSLNYVSLQAVHVDHQGWSLRVWHRHEGEKDICSPMAQYEGLTVDELVDTAASVLAAANETFLRDGEGCHPQPRLPGT